MSWNDLDEDGEALERLESGHECWRVISAGIEQDPERLFGD